jgi:predicted outer membrane protein
MFTSPHEKVGVHFFVIIFNRALSVQLQEYTSHCQVSPTTSDRRKIVEKNVLKGLLAVSAVAATLGAFGVQAQTAGQPGSAAGTTQGQGGKTGQDKTTGSSSGSSGMSGSTGTSGAMSQGASGAAGATAAAAPMSKADAKILMDIAQGNINEIEAAKMAQSKSTHAEVKAFGQQMIDDHTKAMTDIQALAQQKGVTLPTEPDAKHKSMTSKYEKMTGDAFDKAYMSHAGITDHRDMHNALMKDEKKAKDPDLKALIGKLNPVVEQHLRSAQQMPAPKAGTTSGK